MIHYRNDDTRPGFNLALEQVLLRRASESAFWLWRNAPAVIVGRHQDAAAEVDLAEAARRGVAVFRRRSGGGAVYHDEGTVNFSFVLSPATSVGEALARFVSLLEVPGAVTERNDVLVEGWKIAGTAQFLAGGRRLFHGCLLWDTDLGVLADVLTPPPGKLRRHGIPSVRARVANLRDILGSMLSADAFLAALRLRASSAFAGPSHAVPSSCLAEAESLAATPPFLPIA